MSDTPPEYGAEGWWKANDGKWYPPHRHPDYVAPPAATPPAPSEPAPQKATTLVAVETVETTDPRRNAIRLLGFLVLAVIAVAILASGPDEDGSDVAAAVLRGAVNEDSAESAPQQQVLNGWVANDLLEVVAYRSVDNRVPQLLVVLIVTVAWAALTAPWTRPQLS